jgi:hypothetical protein
MSAEAESSPSGPSLPLELLDKALALQTPLTERHIARLRRNRPEATPRQIAGRLNAELRAATISAGVGVGAAAAAPTVGTGVALALSGTEAVAFLNATVLYILARGEVQASRSRTSNVAERWSWPSCSVTRGKRDGQGRGADWPALGTTTRPGYPNGEDRCRQEGARSALRHQIRHQAGHPRARQGPSVRYRRRDRRHR